MIVIFSLGSFYIIFGIWCSDSRYCTLSVQMQCNILSTSISSAIQGTFWWKFIWCSSVKSIKWNSNALLIYLWKIDRPFLLICSYSGKHPIFSYTRTNNVTQKNKLMLKDVTKLSGVHLHLSIKLRDSWSYTFSMIPLICKDSSFGFVIFQKRAA